VGIAVRDNLSRIAGWVLLAFALILVIFSPSDFNIVHFYMFLFCFTGGILLVIGMIGTHPRAARLRRTASQAAMSRTRPLCHVPEQVFPCAVPVFHRRVVTGICALIGISMVGLGLFMMRVFPSTAVDSFLAGIPPLVCGIFSLWISFRYSSMYVRVTPQGITRKGYFCTVALPWQNVLVLIAGEKTVIGFLPIGAIYSLYSENRKLWFPGSLPGSDRLIPLVAEATGLTWNSVRAEYDPASF
jgi:hypothetical protein